MKNYGVFDIIGPVMIGPSSSHTAGAARLGRIARRIAGGEIQSVCFELHGSFAKTYRGHGTDKALVAGILDLPPWSSKLRQSFELAQEQQVFFEFIPTDLGNAHPNTVRMTITCRDGSRHVITGSSIGGGNVIITNIDGTELSFSGENPTIITKHKDVPGVISFITGLLYQEHVNIAGMQVYRTEKGQLATMVLELDNRISRELIEKFHTCQSIQKLIVIQPEIEQLDEEVD